MPVDRVSDIKRNETVLKIVSFNINGLRARLHQLQAIIDKHTPDIIGLQESKVNDPDFPRDAIEAMGYQVAFHGQKAHYGVALLSRNEPLSVQKGYPSDDDLAQRRLIVADYAIPVQPDHRITVVNGYFPQGESRDHAVKFPAKQRFYEDLMSYLTTHHAPDRHLAIMGDFNISPTDLDIGIGEKNAKRWLRTGKCSFLPEEREWYQRLQDWGLKDSFRLLNPDVNDRFSWFDYRSRGFEDEPKRGLRIDHILLTESLAGKCVDAGIDYEIRGIEKPSDHCPIWASFDFNQ